MNHPAHRSFGNAWMALCFAIALHVLDEALNGFLTVYNPTVLELRSRLGWFPVPTFSFDIWLAGLIVGILLLALLGVFAYRGNRRLVLPAKILAVIMMGNALLHTVATVFGQTVSTVRFSGPMPGVYSSPILFAAALWLFVEARHATAAPPIARTA